MISFVPLRVLTMIIGLLLGYNVGNWIELLYKKQDVPREAIETLLYKVAEHIRFDGMEEDEQDDLERLCAECCDSCTCSNEEDTEHSE